MTSPSRIEFGKAAGLIYLTLSLIVSSQNAAVAQTEIPGFEVTTLTSTAQARGLTIDGNGNLYTIGGHNGILCKIESAGPDDCVAVVDLTDLNYGYVGPHFDPSSGNLFVSEYNGGSGTRVLQIELNGSVSEFATNVPRPAGLASDPSGNIFVSSYQGNGAVYKCRPDGNPGNRCQPCGTGLDRPDGLAISPGGDVFVAARETNQIMTFPATCGPATAVTLSGGSLSNPIALTFDSNGKIIVANFNNGTLSQVDLATGPATIAAFGSEFLNPDGLVFDADGNLFIADFGVGIIYKASPTQRPRLGPLTCYRINPVIGVPPFDWREAIIKNEFGDDQRVVVLGPELLCIPSTIVLAE